MPRRSIVTVTHLFLKRGHGQRLEVVSNLEFGRGGLVGNVACSPLRQVLLTSQSVTADCGLQSGDLRENIVVDVDELYDLPSGTVVKIGEALIRLTFHCEPCRNVLSLIDFDRILHKRGVLGCFLNSGSISIGDAFSVTEQKYEPIPYELKERVRWFLRKQDAGLAATDLVHTLGLPSSCARVLPAILSKWRGGRDPLNK